MAQDQWPLSDPSVFRLPEVTAEGVRNRLWYVLALALTVLLTVLAQTRVRHRLRMRSRRVWFDRFSSEHRMEPGVRAPALGAAIYASGRPWQRPARAAIGGRNSVCLHLFGRER